MKYAVITSTLYFEDHERKEQLTINLKEELKNGNEKKQVEEFIISYRNMINYMNNDFIYLLIESVTIEEGQKKEVFDIAKLDI